MSNSHPLDKICIIKQGWLQKKSRHIGSWKSRWTVLTAEYLYTFKNANLSGQPTEIIQLSTIDFVIIGLNSLFTITTGKSEYQFKANTDSDRNKWTNSIDKYIHNCVKVVVMVECHRNNDYNSVFELVIPYDQSYLYSMNDLVADIIEYMNRKHQPLQFVAQELN
eukprot:474489_1